MRSKMELKYYWIVIYRDGEALSQFNPDTGEEYLWREVDQSRVCRVAWCEFSQDLAEKIKIDVVSVKKPKMYHVDFSDNEKILICRRNHIFFSPNSESQRHEVEYLIGKGESGTNENIIVRLN